MRSVLVGLIAAAAITTGATAAFGFQVVSDQSRFVELVKGKQLTRFGIRLTVTEDGSILGRAFGRNVTGNWRWLDGFFCRDLYYGSRDLGPNCQQVKVDGSTLRFTSDRGAGIYADLELR